MTKISATLSIISPILCVLAQFYAIFQDFLLLSGFFLKSQSHPCLCTYELCQKIITSQRPLQMLLSSA